MVDSSCQVPFGDQNFHQPHDTNLVSFGETLYSPKEIAKHESAPLLCLGAQLWPLTLSAKTINP